MPVAPVDLRLTFGHTYVVTAEREPAEGPRDQDPWLALIVTRTGQVYPYSATHLGVQVDGHPRVAGRLARMGYPLIQDGDSEKTFLVPAGDLDRIARLIKPRRRRRFKDAAERAARLAEARQRRGQQA
jgi:hypothetical protein